MDYGLFVAERSFSRLLAALAIFVISQPSCATDVCALGMAGPWRVRGVRFLICMLFAVYENNTSDVFETCPISYPPSYDFECPYYEAASTAARSLAVHAKSINVSESLRFNRRVMPGTSLFRWNLVIVIVVRI